MSIFLVVPFIILVAISFNRTNNVVRALIDSVCLFAGFTLVGCEALSLFHLYSLFPLLCYWVVVSVCLSVIFRSQLIAGIVKLRQLKLTPPSLFSSQALILGIIMVFIGGTLFTALIYPPTINYDSMTYHLPRVFFWQKNASVHNYPTAIGRQLHSGCFSEFLILQFQVLNFNSDVMANMVQWLAYVLLILTVPLIAKELGASKKGIWLTALLTAVTPLAVLQARTTQTDLLVSLWCVVVVYYLTYFIKHNHTHKQGFWWALLLGLATGAAALTKNTALAVLAPFALILMINSVKKYPLKTLISWATVAMSVIVIFNLGFWVRNYLALSGDFLAYNISEHVTFYNNSDDYRYRFSTLVMNLGYNFGSSSRVATGVIDKTVTAINRWLNLDDATENAKYLPASFTSYLDYPGGHDIQTNFWQLVLALVSGMIILFFAFKDKKLDLSGQFFLACVLGMLLVCYLTAWRNFMPSRYTLPVVMIGVSFIIIGWERIHLEKKTTALSFLMFFVVVTGLKCLFFDYSAPLIPWARLAWDFGVTPPPNNFANTSREQTRIRALFLEDSNSFFKLQEVIKNNNIKSIGIDQKILLSIYPYLYPWRSPEYDVRYINAQFLSSREDLSFQPEAILLVDSGVEDADNVQLTYHDLTYQSVIGNYNKTLNTHYLLLLPIINDQVATLSGLLK